MYAFGIEKDEMPSVMAIYAQRRAMGEDPRKAIGVALAEYAAVRMFLGKGVTHQAGRQTFRATMTPDGAVVVEVDSGGLVEEWEALQALAGLTRG